MRARLFFQIYGAVLMVGFCCILAMGIMAWTLGPPAHRSFEGSKMAEMLLDVPSEELPNRLNELSEQLNASLVLQDSSGDVVLTAGTTPAPRHGPGLTFHLSDGRSLRIRTNHPRPSFWSFFLGIGTLALLVAIGCIPLARRLTFRLEALQSTALRWGEGDLQARVDIQGSDEIADVAKSFNLAADRVQGLIEVQRRALASTSHELRSPLARVRMAIELLRSDPPNAEQLFEQTVRDIEELDETVGDLLQVGKMQSVGLIHPTEVDLLEVLAEEGARGGVEVSGEPYLVLGDRRLLQRLIRNLIENAQKYGGDQVRIFTDAEGFRVVDNGSGIPAELREQVFEPFYRPESHAEGEHGGVGLGLWLAREIAEHHHGSLRIGGGVAETALICRLPRSSSQPLDE